MKKKNGVANEESCENKALFFAHGPDLSVKAPTPLILASFNGQGQCGPYAVWILDRGRGLVKTPYGILFSQDFALSLPPQVFFNLSAYRRA